RAVVPRLVWACSGRLGGRSGAGGAGAGGTGVESGGGGRYPAGTCSAAPELAAAVGAGPLSGRAGTAATRRGRTGEPPGGAGTGAALGGGFEGAAPSRGGIRPVPPQPARGSVGW